MAKWQSLAAEPLREGFHGDILLPGDPGYDDARRVWNGMFDRKPAVIARPAATEDVVRAVNFAREHQLTLSVKGGGHNLAGTAVVDEGLMVDLSAMRHAEADPQSKTVRVQGGALLHDLDTETQRYGLAVPAGIISHTGVGGLTLGGGFGWISRKYGFSVDNLIGAEVVTASGNVVTASETENPDLFWGLRGGGGNFGIATSLVFRCAEIGTEVYSGIIVKRFDDLKPFMRFYHEYVRTLPDEMTVWAVIRKAPPLPFLPAEHHGQLVIAVPVVYLGKPEDGERLIEPLRNIIPSLGEHVGMNPWVGWQSGLDGLVPHGARNYWKSHDMTDLPEALADNITRYMQRAPSDDTQVVLVHLEGAVSRVPETATAYPHRRVPFLINVEARWQDPKDDERCISWAREFDKTLQPYAKGVYVNFLSEGESNRIKEAYTPEVWNRLVEVKKKWDPQNVFHMNHNITPA